jgi:hypothetical protein
MMSYKKKLIFHYFSNKLRPIETNFQHGIFLSIQFTPCNELFEL